jgi:predicted anti-sigma-YlaC factor YlaD
MLIHLLTCLALTAVTLTLFSRFILDIGQTEEHPS